MRAQADCSVLTERLVSSDARRPTAMGVMAGGTVRTALYCDVSRVTSLVLQRQPARTNVDLTSTPAQDSVREPIAMDTTRDLRHRRLHSAVCLQELRSAIISSILGRTITTRRSAEHVVVLQLASVGTVLTRDEPSRLRSVSPAYSRVPWRTSSLCKARIRPHASGHRPSMYPS